MESEMPKFLISRRESLGLAASVAGAAAASALGAASAAAAPAAAKKPNVDFVTKVDFNSPEWNRDIRARMTSDVDPTKEKLGWLKGKVYGVRPNEAVRTLFAFEGFSLVRTKRLPDGSWRRLLRETVFYRDIKTGKILKTWHNPYTNETVRVVPIANNPYNSTVTAYSRSGKPYLGEWIEGPNNTLTLYSGVNLFYPNLLQPSKWPRESAGEFNQVTENFYYTVNRADAENPNLTNVPVLGAWQRITPWLPWMLMGAAPGHIDYFSMFATIPGGRDGLKNLPQDLVEAARENDPLMLSAPTEDNLPNESSLEAYAKEQQPAPVPPGWQPPQPPPPPEFTGDPANLGRQGAGPSN